MPTPAIQRMFLSLDRQDVPASSKSTAEHSANKMMQLRMCIAHCARTILQPCTLPLLLVVTYIVATYSSKSSTAEHRLHYFIVTNMVRDALQKIAKAHLLHQDDNQALRVGVFAALYNTWRPLIFDATVPK